MYYQWICIFFIYYKVTLVFGKNGNCGFVLAVVLNVMNGNKNKFIMFMITFTLFIMIITEQGTETQKISITNIPEYYRYCFWLFYSSRLLLN